MITRLAALGLLTLGTALAPAAQAADMFTGWQDTGLPQDQCLNRAADKLREMGFRVNVTRGTTFAWRNQDGVSVRCIGEKRIAVFFVYAASGEAEGRATLDQLHAAFRGGSTAPPASSGGGGKF